MKILRDKMPLDVEFEPPSDLSDSSKRLWRDLVPSRARSPGRLALIAVALQSRDRAEKASAVIAAEGMVTTTGTTKVVHVHPLVRVEKDARALFARCWADLGLGFDARIDGSVYQRVAAGFPAFEDEDEDPT